MKEIEDELLMCDQFQPLLQTLKELEKKHISGEILTINREWIYPLGAPSTRRVPKGDLQR